MNVAECFKSRYSNRSKSSALLFFSEIFFISGSLRIYKFLGIYVFIYTFIGCGKLCNEKIEPSILRFMRQSAWSLNLEEENYLTEILRHAVE